MATFPLRSKNSIRAPPLVFPDIDSAERIRVHHFLPAVVTLQRDYGAASPESDEKKKIIL
jgi:hypothetical protein